MLLTRFVRCAACGREVRVQPSGVEQAVRRGVQLTDDAAVAAQDGSFVCPFCGATQRPDG